MSGSYKHRSSTTITKGHFNVNHQSAPTSFCPASQTFTSTTPSVLHIVVLSSHLTWQRVCQALQTDWGAARLCQPSKMIAQKRLFGPCWNLAGKKSLKGNRKCKTSFSQMLLQRQHGTQLVGRDFFWSGPNATWAGLAGIRKLRSSLHADNKCKCYLWQVQTYCSCYSEVAEQALLFFLQSRFIPAWRMNLPKHLGMQFWLLFS